MLRASECIVEQPHPVLGTVLGPGPFELPEVFENPLLILGRDADTVRGFTPEQMGDPAAVDSIKQRLVALEARVGGTDGVPLSRDRLYTHASRTLESQGTERFVAADCDDPNDVALNCSGGAYDRSTAFPITWVGIMLRDDPQGNPPPERCMVVVGAGATTPNLEATIRCMRMP